MKVLYLSPNCRLDSLLGPCRPPPRAADFLKRYRSHNEPLLSFPQCAELPDGSISCERALYMCVIHRQGERRLSLGGGACQDAALATVLNAAKRQGKDVFQALCLYPVGTPISLFFQLSIP